MAAQTDYMRNRILDHITQAVSYTPPAGLWLGLFLTPTDQLGSGTEVSGGAYARMPISMGSSVSGRSDLLVEVYFPTATADWGTVTHAGIFDAVSGGNMLFYGKFQNSTVVNSGNTKNIPKGSLILSIS